MVDICMIKTVGQRYVNGFPDRYKLFFRRQFRLSCSTIQIIIIILALFSFHVIASFNQIFFSRKYILFLQILCLIHSHGKYIEIKVEVDVISALRMIKSDRRKSMCC